MYRWQSQASQRCTFFGRSWLRIYAQSLAFLLPDFWRLFPSFQTCWGITSYRTLARSCRMSYTSHSHSSTLYNINIWEGVVQWTKVWVLFSIDKVLTRRERKFEPEQNKKCRHKQIWAISDFRRGVNDIFALLGWRLPTLRNNVSVLPSISPRRILGCSETSVVTY